MNMAAGSGTYTGNFLYLTNAGGLKFAVGADGSVGIGGAAGTSVLERLKVYSTDVNGANIRLFGNGATTPSKYIRAQGGNFEILNNAYGAALMQVTDAGQVSLSGLGGSGDHRTVCANSSGTLYTVASGVAC
jgi:hypothetical protein